MTGPWGSAFDDPGTLRKIIGTPPTRPCPITCQPSGHPLGMPDGRRRKKTTDSAVAKDRCASSPDLLSRPRTHSIPWPLSGSLLCRMVRDHLQATKHGRPFPLPRSKGHGPPSELSCTTRPLSRHHSRNPSAKQLVEDTWCRDPDLKPGNPSRKKSRLHSTTRLRPTTGAGLRR